MSSSNSVDRLSMLPDDILSHILSLMPTTCAVRTSILSKRWRYRWMSVTNIYFDENYFHPIINFYSCVKFIDRVFELYKTSNLNLFRLQFRKVHPLESRVSKWIEKAVGLNVHELDLKVDVIQLRLFTCKTLTKLRLDCRAYNSNDCKFPVNLPCLKTLDIAGYIDHVVASNFISGCPRLEHLSIQVISHDKEDYIFNIPTLKRLKVTWLSFGNLDNQKVVLNVPNLEYLFVGGALFTTFVMKDVSSLVEASICIDEMRDSHEWWDEILEGLSGVKSLSLQIKLVHSCWIKPKRVPACCMLTKLTSMMLSNCNGQACEIEFLEYILGNAEVLKTLTITWKDVMFVKEIQLRAHLLAIPRASQDCQIRFLESGSTPSTLVKRTG